MSEPSAESSSDLPPGTRSENKVATNVAGLDDVLHGGLPKGRLTLVRGGPGAGKTVFALDVIYRGALAGEPGLFVSFEEQLDVLRRNAKSLGWDLEPLERSGKLTLVHPRLPAHFLPSGEYDIAGMLAILGGHAERIGATRICLDAPDILLRWFHSDHERESQLFAIHDWLSEQAPTALITLKELEGGAKINTRAEYLADCVIYLDTRVVEQVSTRRLRVIKYRGSAFMTNEFPYVIGNGGIALIPVSRGRLPQRAGEKISTGIDGLDPLLDGGFRRKTCSLVSGASGTGKTTLACLFSIAAAGRGEKVLFVTFEQSLESLEENMLSAGIDLRPAVQSGNLQVMADLPEAMGVEEHLWAIIQRMEHNLPQHLVIDPISATERIDSEEAAFEFLLRLLSYCHNHGITCLFLHQADSSVSAHEIQRAGVASLVDALLLLKQEWKAASHRRRLLVVKSRGSRHSHHWHTFQINDQGITVEDPVDRASKGERS